MKLINECKNIVKNNINEQLDENTLECISLAVLAIKLTLPEEITKNIPDILKKLKIYAQNKSVLEIAHNELNNYMEDEELSHSDAAVTRSIGKDDETGVIFEQWNLLISLNINKKTHKLIGRIIHELIHLLRFKGIIENGNDIKILDGISTAFVKIEPVSVKRKHYNFEEGIVQTYTNLAMKTLGEYNTDSNELNSTLEKYKKEIKKYDYKDYILETEIISLLNQNSYFNSLLLNTFTETNLPSNLINYYNQVMNDTSAFTRLSKKIDDLAKVKKEKDGMKLLEEIVIDVKKFLALSKFKKLNLNI